jgi:acyl carrier protein
VGETEGGTGTLDLRVAALVVDVLQLDVGASDVAAADNILEEFAIDSAGTLTLVTAIEDEFEVEFADEDITRERFRSVASLAEFVRSQR